MTNPTTRQTTLTREQSRYNPLIFTDNMNRNREVGNIVFIYGDTTAKTGHGRIENHNPNRENGLTRRPEVVNLKTPLEMKRTVQPTDYKKEYYTLVKQQYNAGFRAEIYLQADNITTHEEKREHDTRIVFYTIYTIQYNGQTFVIDEYKREERTDKGTKIDELNKSFADNGINIGSREIEKILEKYNVSLK